MGLFSELGVGGGKTPMAKKGFFGFWNRFARDGWSWVFSGALAVAGALPYAIGLIVSVQTTSLLPMVIAAPLGGMLAAPELVCMADTLLRSMRDEDFLWWRAYRKSWARNFKSALLPGLIFGTLSAIQFFSLYYAMFIEPDITQIVWLGLSIFLTTAVLTYTVVISAAVDLKFPALIKAGVVLLFHKPLRTLAAVLLQLLYWAAAAWFYPKSLPVFIIFQFWFPMSVATAIIYPPVERAYDLENQIKKLRERQR